MTFLLVTICFSLVGCQKTPDKAAGGAANGRVASTEITPDMVERHDQGVALMGQFDYSGAHDVFDQLVRDRPNWFDAKVDLAIAKLNRRQETDVKNSETLLDEVIQTAPENLRAKYCRALLLLYAAEPQRARNLFQDVASADPTDAYAIYYAGQCLLESREYEPALEYFERAQKVDPYLRSAYYGAFQTLQRMKRADEAKAALEVFQKLADNPQARAAEMKYSRMGPKAEARTVSLAGSNAIDKNPPQGSVFAKPSSLVEDLIEWGVTESEPTVTACDLNGDGAVDLFLSGAKTNEATDKSQNLVLFRESGRWVMQPDHPLTRVAEINSVLWGDFDNDSLVDVYFCRHGLNQLWRQVAAGKWEDVTESTKTAAGDFNTVDGAMFDADHDGDLDLFLANSDGPDELLNNNLDGTFRPLGEAQGISGGDTASVGVVVADLDSDRDADIVVLKKELPHEVFLNNRLWNYTPAENVTELSNAAISAAVAVDTNADGQVEIITVSTGKLLLWEPDASGQWSQRSIGVNSDGYRRGPVAAQDVNGDGRIDVVATSNDNSWQAIDCFADEPSVLAQGQEWREFPWALVNMGDGKGYSIVSSGEGATHLYGPGPGRYSFVDLLFTGRESKADQMRSNTSGIGVQAAARIGGRWTALQTFRDQSGPGQSRQPIAVGLNDRRAIDFVKLLWPDGLLQTELGLAAGKAHQIEETQRQVSSCPVLFVWNGELYEFVSDVLGVGGLGFNGGRGEYHPPRPWENLVLPSGVLQATDDGLFRIKIGEPMEEACYLDSIRLVAYDVPEGWSMTMDERQAVSEPLATGAPIFYRQTLSPSKAINSEGRDVLDAISTADGRPMEPGKLDPRFLAHCEPFSVTLEFDESLSDLPGRPVLVIDGWVEYPYSQTMFASWQASASYDAPSLEAKSADGEWQMVYEHFGYPAGMPRQMALPIKLDDLPTGTVQLRISSSMEIYWDRMFVAVEEKCDGVQKRTCRAVNARVQQVGFPQRTNHEYRRPEYDYSNRVAFWDTRHSPGFYSNFGDALPLLTSVDDAVAIIGPGEEVELQFQASQTGADPADSDGSTIFVLECHGWCKDMDLYTEHGETLGPMPRRENVKRDHASEQARDELMRTFNQRYEAGSSGS